jgi:two-component system response regulator HydG
MSATRVLVVDDDAELCGVLAESLGARGFSVETRTSAEQALADLPRLAPDVVLTDLNLRGADGLALCRDIVDRWPDVPVLVITAFGNLESAVGAIRAGAYDFLQKPFDADVVALALDRAARHRALRDEVARLRDAVDAGRAGGSILGGNLLGESAAMRDVAELVARVADTEATVLITGETGTGKELVAETLHARSGRSAQPFVAFNCAAIPESLLESELFGHVRGAFTDAREGRAGLFVRAGKGTLFLDEIGDLPGPVQAKLLRALHERRVRPVGADHEVPFEARLVCATHRDLEADVESGRFRQDLYFRIDVIQVRVPPLRARGMDVLLLAQHFLRRYAARDRKEITGLSPQAAERLLRYAWPGNVRELQNCIERAVALARGSLVQPDDLPERIRDQRPSRVVLAADEPADLVPLDEVERRYVLRVLEVAGGNKKLAASILGLDRSTLYRKLERWGVAGSDG